MARTTPIRGGVERHLRAEFRRRGERALVLYRRAPLRRDAAGYPFGTHPEDGSIRDRNAADITDIPHGIRISVASRGAFFIEEGNDSGGKYIKGDMAIPLRGAVARRGSANKARRSSGRRQFKGQVAAARASGRGRAGQVVIGDDGRAYLSVRRVRTFRGRHLLRRSIGYAFTGRSGLSGRP